MQPWRDGEGKRAPATRGETGANVIESIQFTNFKALRDTTLPLGPFTLLVGANGCGKSTVLRAIDAIREFGHVSHRTIVTAQQGEHNRAVQLVLKFGERSSFRKLSCEWKRDVGANLHSEPNVGLREVNLITARFRTFAFLPAKIAEPTTLVPQTELSPDGSRLAGVLDGLRDSHPERFAALNEAVNDWLPEFDQILFDVPGDGKRSISLRQRRSQLPIAASNLSDGTLTSLALLAIAYLPDPPTLVGLEEPDHAIHPRLLPKVQEALYRLAYPSTFGEKRSPVQVIATTHSPHFLDLFKDHPEEVVIAEKGPDNVEFKRLSEQPKLQEILGDAPLGDIWYSGILGGVPTEQ
jgi:predicted ATPase